MSQFLAEYRLKSPGDTGEEPRYNASVMLKIFRSSKKIATLFGIAALGAAALLLYSQRRELLLWYELRPEFSLVEWRNSWGLPEYLHERTGIVMVLVPGGTFSMGAPEEEEGSQPDERPMHEVTLGTFLVAKYEVSQAQWVSVMGTNPSYHRGDQLPVEKISYDDVQAFCRKTGLAVPSEAQWEYACRAGTSGPFSSGSTLTSDRANFDDSQAHGTGTPGSYRGKTVAVTAFDANGFGLYSMHGNVWEWCKDVYAQGFYASPKASAVDPVATGINEGWGVERVIRGGGWLDKLPYCRSALRGKMEGTERHFHVGFRAVYPVSLD